MVDDTLTYPHNFTDGWMIAYTHVEYGIKLIVVLRISLTISQFQKGKAARKELKKDYYN